MNEPFDRTISIKEVKSHKSYVDVSLSTGHVRISTKFDKLFLPGEVLTEELEEKLTHANDYYKAESYLSHFLPKNRMTVKACKKRLSRYGLSKEETEELLKPYIKAGYLDDQAYCEDYILEKRDAGYGPNRILFDLRRKGVPEEIIKDSQMQELLHDDFVPQHLLMRLYRRFQEKTTDYKKEKMVALLLARGHERNLAIKAVTDFLEKNKEDSSKEEEKRLLLLGEEAEKCYNRLLLRKKTTPQKQTETFRRSLLSLGFTFEEIRRIEKEKDYTFK